MTVRPDRRKFVLSSSAGIGGMLLLGARESLAEDPAITKKRLVLLGLNGLARAPEMNYFADGHRGAAMISAHLLCVEQAR